MEKAASFNSLFKSTLFLVFKGDFFIQFQIMVCFVKMMIHVKENGWIPQDNLTSIPSSLE